MARFDSLERLFEAIEAIMRRGREKYIHGWRATSRYVYGYLGGTWADLKLKADPQPSKVGTRGLALKLPSP